MGLFTAQRVSVTQWILAHGRGQIGPVVGVDFETDYSSTYSVSQLGNYAYTHDPRFNAWAVGVTDGVLTCVCRPYEFPWGTIAGCEWVSHNREFDWAVFQRLVELGVIGSSAVVTLFPPFWSCSAAACAFHQLPRDLAGAAKAVFGVDLSKEPRAQSKGCAGGYVAGDAEYLAGFGREGVPLNLAKTEYVALDAEMALSLWNVVGPSWPSLERLLFELTCAMGRRGVCVSWEKVFEYQGLLVDLTESLRAGIPWSPPLSLSKFEAACVAAGVPVPASTAADAPEFQEWAQKNQRSEVVTYARHMQRWRSINRVSKVLDAMVDRGMPDRRMAYELKYFGASTGRWSGGGGLNLQNFNRQACEGVDLRSCIVAPAGFRLAVVDLCQIESRVLLYLAGDVATLDLFRANPDADAYEIHARATMGYAEAESLREYCARTGSGIRQLAKARVLGLGFGCGAQRFIEVAKVMAGLDVEPQEAERIVAEFRASNPKIVQLWQRLQAAIVARDGDDYALPLPCTQWLPSCERYLIYRDVQVCKDGIECTIGGDRVKVYGGLLAENWTQATARDVLSSIWLRCVRERFHPVLSVHDELVFEVPVETADADLARIVEIFEKPMLWAPGLPLRAEGKLCDVYGK